MSTQPNTNVTAIRRAGGQRKLTAKVIETALPREKRYRIADTEVRGLYLSVEPSGAKSFIARGRVGKGRGARSADITIGSTDSVRLSDARDTALGHLVLMRSGQDPRRPTEAPRCDASVAAYIQSLVKRDVVSVPQVEMTLHRAVAGITTMKINELTRRDLVVIIDRIDGTVGAAAGKKTQSVLSAWLNWAANEDFLPANVLAGYRRTRKAKQPDQWTLHHNDLPAFWAATTAAQSAVYRDFLRFLIMTGQRHTETALMRWADVDLETRAWHIPAAHRKTRVAQEVPLSDLAMSINKRRPRISDLVFPGRDAPIAGWSVRLRPVKAALGEDRLAHHGLRRGYRSGLSHLGVRTEVAELMIGHARVGLVGLYDKSDLWEERIEAQRKWEAFVSEAVA